MPRTGVAAEVVVVMARFPTPGRVKTRLAAAVGDERACALYRAFLADRAEALGHSPWQLVWAVEPAGSDLGAIVGSDASVVPQRGRDLGERMGCCFGDLFEAGAMRVVMIGADAPHLGHSTIAEAFAALHAADVVLVPSADGGYCLIGLVAPVDLFSQVAMGTPVVFAQTRQRIAELGLSLARLPDSFDVDEFADLNRLEAEIDRGAVRLPHTEAVLRQWRTTGLLAAVARTAGD